MLRVGGPGGRLATVHGCGGSRRHRGLPGDDGDGTRTWIEAAIPQLFQPGFTRHLMIYVAQPEGISDARLSCLMRGQDGIRIPLVAPRNRERMLWKPMLNNLIGCMCQMIQSVELTT